VARRHNSFALAIRLALWKIFPVLKHQQKKKRTKKRAVHVIKDVSKPITLFQVTYSQHNAKPKDLHVLNLGTSQIFHKSIHV